MVLFDVYLSSTKKEILVISQLFSRCLLRNFIPHHADTNHTLPFELRRQIFSLNLRAVNLKKKLHII